MEIFKELAPLAEKIGEADNLSRLIGQTKAMLDEDDTQVLILGCQNSGKTTLLNKIVDKEVREPDLLSSEDEKPLRVTFDKRSDDTRYDCVFVMNNDWYAESAVIYEMKAENISRGELDTKDIVFYTVSALAPLSSADVGTIDALSGLKVYVILNKLDLIDDGVKDRVIKYVADFCTERGLDAPIIPDGMTDHEFSEKIRSLMPAPLDIKDQREEHIRQIYKNTLKDYIEKAKAHIEEEKNTPTDTDSDSRLADALRGKFKADTEAVNIKVRRQTEESLRSKAQTIADKLCSSGEKYKFSEEWVKNIFPKTVLAFMDEAVGEVGKNTEDILNDEMSRIKDEAADSGVYGNIEIKPPVIRISVVDMPNAEEDVRPAGSVLTDGKTLTAIAVAGGAIALFTVLPIPKSISWFGAVGSAVAGGIAIHGDIKEYFENNADSMRLGIHEYCLRCADYFIEFFNKQTETYCTYAADVIAASSAKAPTAPDKENGREAELEAVISKCSQLLDTNN